MSVKKIFGIYGSGGFSREVMPVLLSMKEISINDTCYVVDEDFLPENNPAKLVRHAWEESKS